MSNHANEVRLSITWDGSPHIEVLHGEDRIVVVAHAGLSEHQVESACQHLEPPHVRERVLQAWRGTMGITSRVEAT